jgi:RNA polymerase sigma-70 factor (ECF subfamily)
MFFSKKSDTSDEVLMREICSGDQKAFTALYHRYSTRMVKYFFRMLWQDEDKAQDFLHDLFVKIIERPEVFDTEKKFSTWIFSVAHNMCKNEYRKVSFRNAAHRTMVAEPATEETASAEIDRQFLQKAIARAMERWEENDRSLFVFRHELEMPFAEIGSVLGLQESTVRSRWFYLRKDLAGSFQQYKVLLKVI